MGDRRIADRREKEKGIIKIKLKDAVKYFIIGVILTASISTNIVLAIKVKHYKKIAEPYLNLQNSIINSGAIDIDQLMENINSNK